MTNDVNEYQDLMDPTARVSKPPVAPEDEFFHSVYISGVSRKNQTGIVEEQGRLQIRGFKYNLDEISVILTHVKNVLVNSTTSREGKDTVECFSFQEGRPWKSSTGRVCPAKSAERAATSFCHNCKSQIIAVGIMCNKNGGIIVDGNNKPVFVFIRARGMKYSNVSEYLYNMSKLDLTPILEPVNMAFEKTVVNYKRFVTTIGIGEATSRYGIKKVFTLTRGTELSKENVIIILNTAKKILPKFKEKFDWSLTLNNGGTAAGGSDYFNEERPAEPAHGVDTFADIDASNHNASGAESVEAAKPEAPATSFDLNDIQF